MASGRVSFSDQVQLAARRLGFDAVGIARASPALDRDFARYRAFIAHGMQGEMKWLSEHADVREKLDCDGILAGAKSVVCVARRYRRHSAGEDLQVVRPIGSGEQVVRDTERRVDAVGSGETDFDTAQNIALYARGRDYHRFLRRRVRRLANFVRSLGTSEHPVLARPMCDDAPVLERAWAVRAGLGFIGKNGMLIVPGLGSMVLLGEVVTTLDFGDGSLPVSLSSPISKLGRPRWGERLGLPRWGEERCGSCTRCLDACPTQAFSAPFVLDPRRCVSYLTIEHRSPIAPELREGIGGHLFGCDDCQTVCPFNAGVAARIPLDARGGDPFKPLDRWSHARLESMLSLDDAAWRAMFEGSPLRRAGRAGIARNAAIVLGNRRDSCALPALRAAANGHEDPMVREAASWAVARIEESRRPLPL
jgi:epoxyqueuosine reductase